VNHDARATSPLMLAADIIAPFVGVDLAAGAVFTISLGGIYVHAQSFGGTQTATAYTQCATPSNPAVER
jgi:hypothetical protein